MRILAATDLLAKSNPAVNRAAMIAESFGAQLSLLHVVPPIAGERALEDEVRLAISAMRALVRPPDWRHRIVPNVAVEAGPPIRRVVDAAREGAAGLVVLGPHRRGGAQDALGATIAERLLSARCAPVLVARRPPVGPYRRVTVAVDLSKASAQVLTAAESLVRGQDAELSVIHAFEPPYEGMLAYVGIAPDTRQGLRGAWLREAYALVKSFLKSHSERSSAYRIVVEDARPVDAILRAASSADADLLVMGTHSRGRIGRALLGSVANGVLGSAECDVLVVPGGSAQAPLRPRRRQERWLESA